MCSSEQLKLILSLEQALRHKIASGTWKIIEITMFLWSINYNLIVRLFPMCKPTCMLILLYYMASLSVLYVTGFLLLLNWQNFTNQLEHVKKSAIYLHDQGEQL